MSHDDPLSSLPPAVRAAYDQVLVQVGGMEPGLRATGLVWSPGKIRQLDLTGMDDGHTETSESGVE